MISALLRLCASLIPLVFSVVLATAAEPPMDATSRCPNVILIITDDQGYGDLSVHGNPVRTAVGSAAKNDRNQKVMRWVSWDLTKLKMGIVAGVLTLLFFWWIDSSSQDCFLRVRVKANGTRLSRVFVDLCRDPCRELCRIFPGISGDSRQSSKQSSKQSSRQRKAS